MEYQTVALDDLNVRVVRPYGSNTAFEEVYTEEGRRPAGSGWCACPRVIVLPAGMIMLAWTRDCQMRTETN